MTTAPLDDPLIALSPTDPGPSATLPAVESPVAPTNGHKSDAQSVHLVLFVHGMWGDPLNLSYISTRLEKQFPPSSSTKSGEPVLDVIVAEANRGNHTYDGVDWGAERVANEFLDYVGKVEEGGERKVDKVSIVGYSLGGLIARYVIGILQNQGFFDRVEPCNFYTFATPHIGLPRYPSFYSSVAYTLGPRWLSRTGEQFYCIDAWGTTGRPLLEIMADSEGVFYQGLERFKRRCLYANAAGDVTVPYVTSAIEIHDPFFHYQTNGIKLTFDPKYPHLITKWELPAAPVAPKTPPPTLSYEYVSSFWPTRPMLPPHLQFTYPYNYVFYALSPLLVPIVAPILIIAILYRFSSASRESRRRIALLEADGADGTDGAMSPTLSRRPTLLSLTLSGTSTPTSTLETGTSSAHGATSPTGSNGKPSASASSNSLIKLAAKAAAREREAEGEDAADGPVPDANALAAAAGEQPMLTEVQRRCAENLNGLGFEKHLVLIEGVRNSHGPIICRAAFQRQGVDVLDHWAERFRL
ncbi:DUF676-domain-containing protein [Calocera viscosa TUFC12733]|uniref:DUF676-domain-containing protein n=1 Tax=Calocera viscosa (strain TUFC12733) TaxID=1330018 RepID=A0A167SDZ1_CALVF|nr:DUF676-domain-containing protein [Calocera viscosa TUFC12733]